MKYSSIIAAFFLFSCSSSISPVDDAIDKQIYHVGNGSEPQGLDPHVVTGVPEHNILIALSEGLTASNPKGGENVSGAAKSWKISEDGLVYKFFLHENGKWSNGDSVTADDFVWSWKRILTASLGSQYPDMLYYVVGAEDYHKGITDDFSKVGIKALDDLTLEVTLKNPTPFFIGLLSHYSTWPVHKETVLKHGSIDDRNGLWTRPGNFVGNGAFKLKEWELNNKIILERNPHYWDANTVKLNEIHYYPVSNIMTEDRMFRSGQLHLTYDTPSQKCPSYLESNPNMRTSPYMGQYFYRINTKNSILQDVRVRKALSLSIDRKTIVEKVTQCGEKAAISITPPGANGYFPQTSLDFDPQKAKQLLIEAGYENGEDIKGLEILFNTNENHRKIALAVQQMWKQNLGISVELVNQDWKVYLAREMIGDYSISRAGWIGDYEDPNTFLDLFRPNRGNNKTGWVNKEYDRLIDLANKTMDQDKRYKLLNAAEEIIMDELPILPIYNYVKDYQISSDVKGFYPNYLDHHHPKYIYLERD